MIKQIHCIILTFLLLLSALSVTANNVENYIKEAEKAEKEQDPIKAAEAYKAAIAVCSNVQRLPLLMFNQGNMLVYAGDYDGAIAVLTKAYEKATKLENPDKSIEARILMRIGTIYFFLNNWDEALSFYLKAQTLATEIDNKLGLSIIDNNIANIYQKKKDYDKAIKLYNHTIELQEDIQDSATICNTLYNIATCYLAMDEPEKAISYINQSLRMANSISDTEIESLSLLKKGVYLYNKGDKQKGLQLIQDSEKKASSAGYKQVLAEIYSQKSEIFAKSGNYHDAYENQKKLKLISDSLFNDNSVQTLREFQVKYDTAEKEHQITLQKVELKRENIQQWALIIGLIACIIIIFVINRYRQLVHCRNRELREMNNTKDKFFSLISHDLKNPAVAQRNALQGLMENYDYLDKTMLMEYYNALLKSADSQVELIYNLLDWARVQTGRIPYNPIAFDLDEMLYSEIDLMNVSITTKNITLTKEIEENLIAKGDRNMTSTAFRNLLTNAMKFTKEGGNIKVKAYKTADGITVSVTDNGVGMSVEKIQNIFQLDSCHSTTGTSGESGSGLGLIVCKNFVERNGGTLSIESTEGQGTICSFTIKATE